MSDEVPPTLGGNVPQARPGWPVAIGVVCIIYAFAALACSCSGLFTEQIFDWLLELDRESGENDPVFQIQVELISQRIWAYIAISAAGMANSAFLLVAAIALIRRRAWLRRAFIAWAILEFVLIALHTALEISAAARTVELLNERGLQSRIDGVWLETTLTVAGMAVVSSILPVFLLIWFSRAKIKQQMSTWE